MKLSSIPLFSMHGGGGTCKLERGSTLKDRGGGEGTRQGRYLGYLNLKRGVTIIFKDGNLRSSGESEDLIIVFVGVVRWK